jgi:hypothetical protein
MKKGLFVICLFLAVVLPVLADSELDRCQDGCDRNFSGQEQIKCYSKCEDAQVWRLNQAQQSQSDPKSQAGKGVPDKDPAEKAGSKSDALHDQCRALNSERCKNHLAQRQENLAARARGEKRDASDGPLGDEMQAILGKMDSFGCFEKFPELDGSIYFLKKCNDGQI